MTAAIAAGITSCTDDHFSVNSDVLGEKTIWQNIQSNGNLSEYADILKSVNYSQTEEKTTVETYADLLNGEQTFTVWAPVNGSFNYTYYKSLISSGVRDSIYKVEKELIRNNMTRFAHVVNGSDSVKYNLFNDKTAWLNHSKCTFQGKQMTTPNIGSSNGMLHVIAEPLEYERNLYEYMASRADLDSLNTFIKSFQKSKFMENLSTQGPTVNGQVTWVDSITRVDNEYTTMYLDAYLHHEDSNYVMIMPTNKAWNEMLDKTKPYFTYKNKYIQDITTQTPEGKDTIITGAETSFTQFELDSLIDFYQKNTICQALTYNANWQYENKPITSIKDLNNVDSLWTTYGIKFKKKGTLTNLDGNSTIECDDYATMFGGKDPIECSNGYAYITDSWNLPFNVIAQNYKLNATAWIESYDNNCKEPTAPTKSYPYKDLETGTDTTYRFPILLLQNKAGTSQPGATFELGRVLSCKYDIYVVLVYNWEIDRQNKFRAYISYDTDLKREKDKVLKNPNEDAVDALGESIYNTNYFVNKKPTEFLREDGKKGIELTDTICLAKDFEFPISYYGLPNAYPTLQIKSNFNNSKEKDYYAREFYISAIILKAKEW